jgi:hypothetical protein
VKVGRQHDTGAEGGTRTPTGFTATLMQ